jgi:hypothetical protein
MRQRIGRRLTVGLAVFLFLVVLAPFSIRAEEQASGSIRWQATAILLDDIARRQKYSIPITEAVDFIRTHSRFKVVIDAIVSQKPHTFTYYDCPAGRQTCVLVNEWDLDQSVWDALHTRDFYMLLWEAGDNPPLVAGGTWGVTHGVPKDGINRPYITLPVDPWWYNNEPFGGFRSRAAQIMTHEIINAINAKLEVAPYFCAPLVPAPGVTHTFEYEASRLAKLAEKCYQKYLENTR